MKFVEQIKMIREDYEERLNLVGERLTEIKAATDLKEELNAYFAQVAQMLLLQKELTDLITAGKCDAVAYERINKAIYEKVEASQYENSFLNHTYAVSQLGEEYGAYLCAVFARIFDATTLAFEGNIQYLTIYAELIVELYNLFEDEETSAEEITDCVYSFMHDCTEIFVERSIGRTLNPDFDYTTQILMESDLSDISYMYRYGQHIGADELASARYLAGLKDEEIQAMADTYTEGYRIGFETCNKDISLKSVVDIRYPIGFERVARAAAYNFEKIGLRAITKPYSSSANRQYDYDHKEDDALWLDKATVERFIECLHEALEDIKDIAPNYGGPAVIEVFGEEPFSPQTKAANPRYSEKQQKLVVRRMSEQTQQINTYIHGDERSFTIIAYPVASIGKDYEAIFAETVRINTLDYMLYRGIQQKLIDALDQADRVHITGCNGNKTDLYVKIWDLKDPDKETAFENCVADVNIPVGEVFTSPVLEGTTGKLHVSQVYLRELNYLNLELDFVDGKISDYTCTNFDTEEENKKYIFDNVLYHHPTLPMGEFAIGTNTTAFKMARDFDIAAKLPILIAEKTGPHFAVGDTCYSFDEDNVSYNPDGKAIVARDNSVSILRKTDMSKAYFNCHTDITIPYDELGAITALCKDGREIDIIRNGRFVLPGTEELNEPLEKFL